MSVIVPFYRAAPWQQVAVNLFYGWGYNFYRLENQLRTDDLLIRAKVSELLAAARADVVDVELAYRREHLPSPTRDNPFPDAQAVRTAKAIQAVADAIAAIESAIRAAPVPENDRMWQRHRNEANTLRHLGGIDAEMVSIAAAVSTQTQKEGAPWIMANLSEIQAAVTELRSILRRRGELLTIQVG